MSTVPPPKGQDFAISNSRWTRWLRESHCIQPIKYKYRNKVHSSYPVSSQYRLLAIVVEKVGKVRVLFLLSLSVRFSF